MVALLFFSLVKVTVASVVLTFLMDLFHAGALVRPTVHELFYFCLFVFVSGKLFRIVFYFPGIKVDF